VSSPPGAGSQPVGNRSQALAAQRREVALALAVQSVEQPLSPQWGPRCLRCGQLAGDSATCPRCKVELRSAEAGAGVVPAGSWFVELIRGVSYLPRGALKLLATPALWPAAVVPLLLNVLTVLGVFLVCWFVIVPWLGQYDSLAELEDWTGWLWGSLSYVVVGLSTLAEYALPVLLPLLSSWLILAFPFNLLYKLLFMPVMELLTEATERRVLSLEEDAKLDLAQFWHNLVLGILDAIFLTLLQGVLLILLLPLHFVIAIGSLLWLVIPPAIFAGMDYTDLNMVRRRYATRAKARLWRTHSWRFFGYGLSFFVFLTIPLVNAVMVPAAAVGGALLYLELDRK
jgi:CysZ protein